MAKSIDFPPQGKPGDSGAAEKPVGVPVVITHKMHEELKNLGLSVEERRKLTPQAAWDILKAGRPEVEPQAASPSEAPVTPEQEFPAPEESVEPLTEEPHPEVPLVADPALALDARRINAKETLLETGAEGEETPLEWREKLRSLITGAKERLGFTERGERLQGYLAERSGVSDTKAKEYGPKVAAFISSGIDRYNKLHWSKKLFVAGSLVAGVSVTSTVAPIISGMLATALYGQRVVGAAGLAVSRRKALDKKIAANPENWFANKSELMKNTYATALAAVYMGSAMFAVHEGIEALNALGMNEWISHAFSHQNDIPVQPHITSVHEAANKIMPPTPAPVHAPSAVTHEAPSSAPQMPTVSVAASEGHGYEYMMKKLWEQLQAQHLDPNRYPPGSDIHRLLTANAHSIDTVVHQIAADPTHDFFHADGTSVLISPHAHMTIGSGGEINLSVSGHDLVHAPTHPPTTPVYHPETSVSAEPPIAIPEAPVIPAEHALPVGTLSVQNIAEHVHAAITPAVTNHFGLEVPLAEPHIYAGPDAKHLFVFGGTPAAQADSIQQYLSAHPKDIIYGTDAANKYRIPYFLGPDGKVTAGLPVRVSNFFGFSSWMKAPRPEDFKKIIH